MEAKWEEKDRYLVFWARLLTSCYLKRHAETFAAFLMGHGSVADFCAAEVDPPSTEADHLQITALAQCLEMPVTVVYLDRSEGSAAEHPFVGRPVAVAT